MVSLDVELATVDSGVDSLADRGGAFERVGVIGTLGGIPNDAEILLLLMFPMPGAELLATFCFCLMVTFDVTSDL